MTKDPHENIFYYYHKGRINEEFFKEKQLENNLTKALVNIFEKSLKYGDKRILSTFLKHFGINSKNISDTKFLLQKSTIGENKIKRIRKKILLGICPEGEQNITEEEERSSLPDAWIYSSDYAILMENKIYGRLDRNQLLRHNRNFRGEIKIKSWDDVYRLLNQENAKNNRVNKLLVEEFCSYLEMINVVSFNGWKNEDFEYFYDRNEDERIRIRNKMKNFVEAVHAKLSQDLKKELKFFDAGKFGSKDDCCWGFLSSEKDKSSVAHFNFCLWADKLTVGLTAQTSIPQGKVKKMLTERQIKAFNLFKKLRNYNIKIYERKRNSKNIRDYYYIDICDLSLDYFSEKMMEYIVNVVQKTRLFEFSILKYYERTRPRFSKLLESEKIINETAKQIELLKEIYNFLK